MRVTRARLLALLLISTATGACADAPSPPDEALELVDDAGVSVTEQALPISDHGYASCVNDCFRSDYYCRKHQASQLDCASQLGHCFDWCEDVYLP